MRLTIREISREFGCEPLDLPSCVWNSYMDIEGQSEGHTRPRRSRSASFLASASQEDDIDRTEELRIVSQRLQMEISNAPQEEFERQSRSTPAASTSHTPPQTTYVNTPQTRPSSSKAQKQQDRHIQLCAERGPEVLLEDFANFKEIQTELIRQALVSGKFTSCGEEVTLKVTRPQPSVLESYGYDHIRGKLHLRTIADDTATAASIMRRRKPDAEKQDLEIEKAVMFAEDKAAPARNGPDDHSSITSSSSSSSTPSTDRSTDSPTATPRQRLQRDKEQALVSNHSMIRVYSLLFAMTFVTATNTNYSD